MAVASLLGSNVPVESATALRRDVARAGGQRLQVVRIARLAARDVAPCQPADGQPVASDSSTAAKLFDVSACCRVRACAWLARRARMVRRTHGACVTSVLCTRVLVCKAQRSERGRGSGEAKPGARHASLFAVQFFAVQQNAERTYCTAYSQSLSSLVLFLAAVTATSVATLHSVVDACLLYTSPSPRDRG